MLPDSAISTKFSSAGSNDKTKMGAMKDTVFTKDRFNVLIPNLLGCVAQNVTCLAADTCLTADPGVVSLILARSHALWRLIMK